MDNIQNPAIGDIHNFIAFKQTYQDTLNTDEYSSFIHNIESMFRKSRFYKDYKANIFAQGIDYDQQMRGLKSNMADIELHHHMPTLKDATIIFSEKRIKLFGNVTTFEVLGDLINAHRRNIMGVMMMSVTNHELYHNDPTAFISMNQLYGQPLIFLQENYQYFPMDIAYKWLLQFKQEEQYNQNTYWPTLAIAKQYLVQSNPYNTFDLQNKNSYTPTY